MHDGGDGDARHHRNRNPPLRKDGTKRKRSAGGDDGASAAATDDLRSELSTTSWRSFASSRRNRESMAGGHIIPRLEDALKTGTVLFFQGTGTGHHHTRNNAAVTAHSEHTAANDNSHTASDHPQAPPPSDDASEPTGGGKSEPTGGGTSGPSSSLDDDEFVRRLAEQIEERTNRELDRDWYAHDEGADVDIGRTSMFDETYLELRGKEDKYKRDHAKLAAKRRAGNVWSQEQDLWELNRLATAGLSRVELDFSAFQDLGDESRNIIMVNDAQPEFLSALNEPAVGSSVVSESEISVVKDPTSDLAVCAKRGSDVLHRLREETERTKLRDRFWELAGTTLGKVLGVKDEKEIEDAQAATEMLSARPAASLGASMMGSGPGITAKARAFIAQQRATLPVFQCKEDLLRMIRENNVCIVVGETGSGKTTQLTQYLYEDGYAHRKITTTDYPPISDDEDDGAATASPDDDGHGDKSPHNGSKNTPQQQKQQEDNREKRNVGVNPSALDFGPTAGGGVSRYKYTMIGCTQPRRIAAVSVAKRVADEFGCQLGREVGYSIRFEDCTSEVTRIKYMTDAFLLREILSDPDLEKYDAIVMDEAHERSLATDVLFGLLKSLLTRRRDLKLIVTSATMNADRFGEFFGNAPIFFIPGRTFPVHIEFARTAVKDYVDAAVQKCLQIHCSFPFDPKDPSDILIFMTGQEDIEGLCIILSERSAAIQTKMQPLSILPIYSQLPSDLQAKVFERGPYRKVVVATNIAETSLTLDGIRFVIDAGFCKLKVFSARVGMDTLQLTPISRANTNQRSGRAGRTAPGMCYRLYTENAYFSEMLESQVPEIQRTNLAHVVLLLKSLRVDDLLSFDFMDPPARETVLNAMFQLWMLGALDDQGRLTPLGVKMAHIPVDPALAKMILLSDRLKCSDELLTVVAMLSVPSVFYRPKGRADEADAAREKFAVPESDHLTLLNVYNQWNFNKCSPTWAAKHFIHQKALIKVRSVRDQLLEIIRGQRIQPTSCKHEWDVVRKAISSGYFHHAAKLKSLGEYINLRTSLPCHLHPSSALFASGLAPDYVVYHEVMVTTKEYMQNVTAVDPCWLAELGPKIFSIRRAGRHY